MIGDYRKKARRSYGFGEGESMQIEAESAQVTEGLSSSVFEIGKPPNIPADKSAHKVSKHCYTTQHHKPSITVAS